MELATGYLNFEQFDAEILNIVDDFRAFGVNTVYMSFGFGCRVDKLLQSREIPVLVSELARFIADCEVDETFDIREADLSIQGAGIEFLLCHEGDIHCSGERSPAMLAVRRRWARDYDHSTERRSDGRWPSLPGRPKDPKNR